MNSFLNMRDHKLFDYLKIIISKEGFMLKIFFYYVTFSGKNNNFIGLIINIA